MHLFIRCSLVALLFLIAPLQAAGPSADQALDPVVFATNWKAQAAQGGFYQALADGTYEDYGLAVSIRQGGPQVNNRPLLSAGRVDFLLADNLLNSFDNTRNGIPTVAVAAFFQEDPQALIAHPDQGYDDFASLTKAPVIFIGKNQQFSWWQWLKVRYGFRDRQLRPYNYSLANFLANPRSVQQGYSIAEPIYVQREADFEPVVYQLSDYGFSAYSTLVEVRDELARDNPDLVQRFVNASIIGWYNYLYGNHQAADARIIADNPGMTTDELEASRELMKRQGIVDSGDALTQGIGTMNAARVREFYQQMVSAGLYGPDEVDLDRVTTFEFINQGVGLEVKQRLLNGAKPE